MFTLFKDTMAKGGQNENVDLVAELLTTPFSRRTFQAKLYIVKRGRPTPELPNLTQQGKGFVRTDKLYNPVIEVFLREERRMDFMFK